VLISRAPDGRVVGYGACGWLALVSTVVMVWWVGQLALHKSAEAASTWGWRRSNIASAQGFARILV